MKLIKIIRNSGKTYRDDNLKIVYHISDKNLSHLSPISSLNGKSGLYVSESYRSIIEDWSSYVISKKHKNHPLLVKRKEILDTQYALEGIIDGLKKNNQEVPQKLQEKLDNIYEKRDNINRQYNESKDNPCYRTLYIHTIKLPQEIYYKAIQEFNDLFNKMDELGKVDLGFWAWGSQVFIQSEYLKYCKIVKVEKLNYSEWMDKIDRLQVGRDDLYNNMSNNKNENGVYDLHGL